MKTKVVSADDVSGATGLYAVFVDEDEKLRVYPATYDDVHKCYWFETGVTGNFVIVKLDEMVESALELNDACRASEEVRTLITLMRLYAFWR